MGVGGVRGDLEISVLDDRVDYGTQKRAHRRKRGSGREDEFRFEELEVTVGHPGRGARSSRKMVLEPQPCGGALSARSCASFRCFSVEGNPCSDPGILQATP